jgi:hypothetical protein
MNPRGAYSGRPDRVGEGWEAHSRTLDKHHLATAASSADTPLFLALSALRSPGRRPEFPEKELDLLAALAERFCVDSLLGFLPG